MISTHSPLRTAACMQGTGPLMYFSDSLNLHVISEAPWLVKSCDFCLFPRPHPPSQLCSGTGIGTQCPESGKEALPSPCSASLAGAASLLTGYSQWPCTTRQQMAGAGLPRLRRQNCQVPLPQQQPGPPHSAHCTPKAPPAH